jgi:hypothetical protein
LQQFRLIVFVVYCFVFVACLVRARVLGPGLVIVIV